MIDINLFRFNHPEQAARLKEEQIEVINLIFCIINII
jgi:hypothetical protein